MRPAQDVTESRNGSCFAASQVPWDASSVCVVFMRTTLVPLRYHGKRNQSACRLTDARYPCDAKKCDLACEYPDGPIFGTSEFR